MQAIRGSSPITSGVQLLPLALTIAPAGMAAGISIGVTCVTSAAVRADS